MLVAAQLQRIQVVSHLSQHPNVHYSHAKPGVTFADAHLAREVEAPSVASGVAEIINPEDGLTWLVEKKRAATVSRYITSITSAGHAQPYHLCFLALCVWPWQLGGRVC